MATGEVASQAPATLGEALAEHYRHHGLPRDGGEHERWFRVRVGSLAIPLPNPPVRKRAVFAHDANHVLTGYNTIFSDGEMVIAGYELGSGGCASYAFAWLANFVMFGLGLALCPRPMFAAFVRGRRASNMYQRAESHAALRAMTVGDVRTLVHLDVPPSIPDRADRALFISLALAVVGGMVAATVIIVAVVRFLVSVAGRA